MVQVTVTPTVELSKDECLRNVQSLKALLRAEHRRHRRLLESFHPIYETLCSVLAQAPSIAFPQGLQAYKESFDLFKTQLEIALPELEESIQWQEPLNPPAEVGSEEWQDFCEEFSDMQKDLKQRIEFQERSRFLEVIKLLDTTERLMAFEIPQPEEGQEQVYQDALNERLGMIVEINLALNRLLYRRRIRPIKLELGAYPPMAYTRILFRDDDRSGDAIIISQIVEKGYFWKESVLRKAAVVVTTKP